MRRASTRGARRVASGAGAFAASERHYPLASLGTITPSDASYR